MWKVSHFKSEIQSPQKVFNSSVLSCCILNSNFFKHFFLNQLCHVAWWHVAKTVISQRSPGLSSITVVRFYLTLISCQAYFCRAGLTTVHFKLHYVSRMKVFIKIISLVFYCIARSVYIGLSLKLDVVYLWKIQLIGHDLDRYMPVCRRSHSSNPCQSKDKSWSWMDSP